MTLNTLPRHLRSVALLLSLALTGCGDSQGTALRTAFLTELSEQTLLPASQDFDTRSGALARALATLQSAPTDANLTAAQLAWRAVREPWGVQKTLPVGPSEELHTGAAVDQPSSTAGIDALLASEDPLTPEAVAELGTNRRGMLAMEYLLFDADNGNAAVLSRLTAQGTPGDRRRTYLASLGEVLHANATAVRTAWEADSGGYAMQLATAGNTGSRYPTQKAAMAEVFNRFVAGVETAEFKLSKPLGFQSGGTLVPEAELTRRSDNTLADLESMLTGMEHTWLGADGHGGLSRVVAASNPSLDTTVRAHLVAVRTALEAIPPPVRTALSRHRDTVENARVALAELRATLATEVAPNLGVTITFSENDGD